VQPDSGPPEPADATLAAPGGIPGIGASARVQQPSLLEEHLEQLAIDEQLATWRAFAAPIATDSGAVIGDPELVRLAVNILAVYANHQSRSGLTYAQLRDGLRQLGSRFPQAAIDARLEHLHRMGFLEPYLPKQYQGRYIVRPAGLAGALAAARVTERGGIDELILLLDRTRAALGTRHPDPVQAVSRDRPHSTGAESTTHTSSVHSEVSMASIRITRMNSANALRIRLLYPDCPIRRGNMPARFSST
jgi:hypothetical protein